MIYHIRNGRKYKLGLRKAKWFYKKKLYNKVNSQSELVEDPLKVENTRYLPFDKLRMTTFCVSPYVNDAGWRI